MQFVISNQLRFVSNLPALPTVYDTNISFVRYLFFLIKNCTGLRKL